MVCKRVDWLCLPTPKGSNYIIPTNNFRYFVAFNTFMLFLNNKISKEIYTDKNGYTNNTIGMVFKLQN